MYIKITRRRRCASEFLLVRLFVRWLLGRFAYLSETYIPAIRCCPIQNSATFIIIIIVVGVAFIVVFVVFVVVVVIVASSIHSLILF